LFKKKKKITKQDTQFDEEEIDDEDLYEDDILEEKDNQDIEYKELHELQKKDNKKQLKHEEEKLKKVEEDLEQEVLNTIQIHENTLGVLIQRFELIEERIKSLESSLFRIKNI